MTIKEAAKRSFKGAILAYLLFYAIMPDISVLWTLIMLLFAFIFDVALQRAFAPKSNQI